MMPMMGLAMTSTMEPRPMIRAQLLSVMPYWPVKNGARKMLMGAIIACSGRAGSP